uniref:Down syndrome critical region protein 3 isoform X1 n=1 Tax=Tanacetum cinerariifolium TaxID=118510 RepID=A0A6L2LKI9_TANCI|nr:down syndrome critical region protein 3 isoform X1 [Tanacetum cinerariifolium]
MSSVEIKLSRSNRTYHPNEAVEGKIITKFSSSLSHHGIHLTLNASVNLQVRGGTAGLIESIYGVLKPIPILKKSIVVKPSGKITAGTTEIPFSIDLKHGGKDDKFYETFHEKPISPEMVFFYITQDTQRHALLPELKSGGFKVSGRICTQCLVSDPLVGELTVEASAVPIYSIEIHLLRVESIMVGEKIATETSIVQTTQIADGDVCRAMSLPIYVMLPRLLTCPTVFAGSFSIEFKVTILVTFQTELYNVQQKSDPRAYRKWVAMESLPLELVQSK